MEQTTAPRRIRVCPERKAASFRAGAGFRLPEFPGRERFHRCVDRAAGAQYR